MPNNLTQMLRSFITGAQQKYGQGFDPSTVAKSMLGNNCSTPQQALQMMLQSGRITQEQFNMFSKML